MVSSSEQRESVNDLSRRRSSMSSTSSHASSASSSSHRSRRNSLYHVKTHHTIDSEVFKEPGTPELTLMDELFLLALKDKEGYVSDWDGKLSYVLRCCVIIELALRGKIQAVAEGKKKKDLAPHECKIEVIDGSITGDPLLDQTLGLMKKEKKNYSVSHWIKLLSGESMNFLKASYQLLHVRKRIERILVETGILSKQTKKLAAIGLDTHPIKDIKCKNAIRSRMQYILTANKVDLPSTKYFPDTVSYRVLRTIVLACAAYGADILDKGFFQTENETVIGKGRARVLLSLFSKFPFELNQAVQPDLNEKVSKELHEHPEEASQLEVVAGAIDVINTIDTVLIKTLF
ncbi:hypothetical protein NCAS_0H02090 [Naumovozyma castellii]|uniref:Uncharacterized protein n=1 Tax=Naumovozyma castellii TaxID=27288 RepID=G0VJ40_NAUCA|nr:hypothetical protein NCAS_0H02090 [Naumovozyma castellii CBS 4309]CCC71519.1 hypothetical protein NCAS_0H02090 [Naumovozyma castellii CBS 4309]